MSLNHSYKVKTAYSGGKVQIPAKGMDIPGPDLSFQQAGPKWRSSDTFLEYH